MKLLHGQGEIIADRYQIVTLLGQGGMGSTYAAVDFRTHQKVAIKVVSLRTARDWKTLELFEREAQVLATLNHPLIPNYLDYFQLEVEEDSPNSDCRFYLVQELVEGESLATLVERRWQPKEAEVKEIALQVLDILVYLHQLQPPILHRDIKPQNLIRQQDGKIYLVDFGTVQHMVRNPQSFVSTFVGSVGYMPPEQLRGQTVFASDLYSLGATLIFLLTGKSPETLPQKMLKVDFRRVIKLSEGFAQWLDRLIAPVIEHRFQSAQEALLKIKQRKQQLERSKKNQIISCPSNPRITLQKSNYNLLVKINYQASMSWSNLAGALLCFGSLITIIKDSPPEEVEIFSVFILLVSYSIFFMLVNFHKITYLEINPEIFKIKWTYFLIWNKQVQGRTEDIAGVLRYQKMDNTPPCILWEGIKPHHLIDEQRVGSRSDIKPKDIEWLVAEISDFLKPIQ
ncbi:MAG: serine/threonine protein kinase [Symploca sp. SIO2E6]|nr:serine/threonine protein kinase [Symploca sp. SIO2E6]